MEESKTLQGRRIIFFLADSFHSGAFEQLLSCLEQMGATIIIASPIKGESLESADGSHGITSDVSFSEAVGSRFDAVVIADSNTASIVKEQPAVLNLIEATWSRGGAIVAVDKGALALVAAGIVDGARIASDVDLYDELSSSGADISDTPVSASGNILSAETGADFNVLCNYIADYIVNIEPSAA